MSNYNLIWLDQNKDLGKKCCYIREKVSQSIERAVPNNQCKHDIIHCESIENCIHHLLPYDLYERFSEKERFYLLLSPWILNACYSTEIYLRKLSGNDYHQEINNWLNDDKNRLLLGINNTEADIFKEIIFYHEYSKKLDDSDLFVHHDGPDAIRVGLLAAYLRLADAIHIDNCDGPDNLFYFIEQTNSHELFHWLKSKLPIKINPKPSENIIEILVISDHLDLKGIPTVLKEEIELHVRATIFTLVKGGIAKYLSVDIKEIPGPSLGMEERNKLERLVNEFDMAFPPNAGTVEILFLTSLERVLHRQNSNEDKIILGINDLLNIARGAYRFRTCHVALKNHIYAIEKLINQPIEKTKIIANINNLIIETLNSRTVRLNILYDIASKELCKYTHFLVFGFSRSVIETFKKINALKRNGDELYIFVCEAHNKSRLNSEKQLIYVDGFKYALELTDAIPNANVKLIPDINSASVIIANQQEKWAAVFGANGITPDAECGHSAGHLSLAIIAKYFKKSIYILADSQKIGKFEFRLDSERESQWLKGVPSWVHHEGGFVLHNLRESIIVPDLIDFIITEDGMFSTSKFKEKYKNIR